MITGSVKGKTISGKISVPAQTESVRVNNERDRIAAENIRVNNERDRIAADAERRSSLKEYGERISRNEKRIINLEQSVPSELYVSDKSVAYIKYAPPRALPYAEINKFGGKVTEIRSGGANMVNSALASQSTTTNGITFTNNGDGSFTLNGEASAQATYYIHQIAKGNTLPLKSGVSYTLSGNAPKQVGLAVYDEKWKTYATLNYPSITFTITDDTLKYGFYIYVVSGTKVENVTVYPMLNVGTEAAPFKPYKETVDTFIIPEEVQALDGYGEGNNYIDLERRIFVANGNEVDISDLITADNFIKVEGGGTITFENEHEIALPSEITYMLKEV